MNYFKVIRICLLLLLTSFSFGADPNLTSMTVKDNIALWRTHIIEKGNFAGVETDSIYYRELEKIGPNGLKDLFDAYTEETNPHVLYYYEMLIRRIGHFDFFEYSLEPIEGVTYDTQVDPNESIPFLSEEIGKERGDIAEQIYSKKDKLVLWWQEKNTFINRPDMTQKVRTVIGSDYKKFKFKGAKARKFMKLGVYGIYNIPGFIDIIAKDNDAVIFSEFLRISNHPEFRDLKMTYDKAQNGLRAGTKYPTSQDKLNLICQWWTANQNTFNTLTDLYSEIEKKIHKYCPKNHDRK